MSEERRCKQCNRPLGDNDENFCYSCKNPSNLFPLRYVSKEEMRVGREQAKAMIEKLQDAGRNEMRQPPSNFM